MQRPLLWFAIPLAFLAGYIFCFQYPTVMDMPNHLARAHILNVCFSEPAAQVCSNYRTEFRPISYFLSDYTLMLLLRVVPDPFMAGKIALFGLLAINLCGWFALCSKVFDKLSTAYIAGLLLLLNNFFFKGFYAYLLGNGALLLWLAFWWPRRDRRDFSAALQLTVGIVILYCCHLAAFFGAATFLGTYALWTLGRTPARDRLTVVREYLTLWPIAVAIVGLYGLQIGETGSTLLLPTGSQGLPADSSLLRWIAFKVTRLGYVTYNHSKFYDTSTVLACFAGLLITSRRQFLSPEGSFWLLAALVLTGAYIILPDISHGGGDVDLRFLLPAYYAAFVWLGCIARDRIWLRCGVVLLVGTSFAFNTEQRSEMDREVAKVVRMIDQIPPGQRVTEINSQVNFPAGRTSRVNPFSHLASYYILRGGAMTDGLLSCQMNPNIPYFCYRDPQDATTTFRYQFEGLPSLDAGSIAELRNRFDYLVVIEPSAALVDQKLLGPHFQKIAQEDPAYLFKTDRAFESPEKP